MPKNASTDLSKWYFADGERLLSLCPWYDLFYSLHNKEQKGMFILCCLHRSFMNFTSFLNFTSFHSAKSHKRASFFLVSSTSINGQLDYLTNSLLWFLKVESSAIYSTKKKKMCFHDLQGKKVATKINHFQIHFFYISQRLQTGSANEKRALSCWFIFHRSLKRLQYMKQAALFSLFSFC